MMDDDLFFVWAEDDIDTSFFEDTDNPRPCYVCYLCRDTGYSGADLVRGYDPRDGIFERPGHVVEAVGGIDVDFDDPYREVIEAELLDQFESRRAERLKRGTQ